MNKKMPQIASLSKRFAAYIIDSVILLIPMYVLFLILTPAPYTFNIINIFVSCIYFTYFTVSPKQATIGQQLLNIYTISCDYKKIRLALAFDRSISQFFLPVIVILLNIIMNFINQQNTLLNILLFIQTIALILTISWYVTAIFSNKNQTLHDIIFKTIVVVGKLK